MRYHIDDASELMRLLLTAFTDIRQPAVEKGFSRYLWRHARFGDAEHLAEALDDVRLGRAGHFVYHQRTTLLFTDTELGYHQLLLAHFAALHETDFAREHVRWDVHQFPYADPIAQLADDCVRNGYGLYISSASNGRCITVGQRFKWEPLERVAFAGFERDVI